MKPCLKMGPMIVTPTLVSPAKSAFELNELHHSYDSARSKVITLERAVDLVEELASLDRTKLDGQLGTASLEGKSNVALVHCFLLSKWLFTVFL